MVSNLLTTNYSVERLSIKKENQDFLRRSNSLTENSIWLNYEIAPLARNLDLQAVTFSDNYGTHGYLEHGKLLRCKNEEIFERLKEMFIYSYIKSLHNGFFHSNFSDKAHMGICLTGHCYFFRIIRSSGSSITRNGLTINSKIDTGSVFDRKVIFALLIQEFPFLRKYDRYLSNIGDEPLFIPELESCLSNYKENYYSVRAHGEPEKVGKTSKGNTISKGRIQLEDMRSVSLDDIQKETHYPLSNAFTNKIGNELYFIESNGKYSVQNNPSFFFCKSNFLCISEISDIEMLKRRYYTTKSISSEEDHLIASEVFSISGIECSYRPSRKAGNDNFDLTKGDLKTTIVNGIGEFRDRLNSLEDIRDLIAEIVETWNQETEPVEK
jgi:hypothetical protein